MQKPNAISHMMIWMFVPTAILTILAASEIVLAFFQIETDTVTIVYGLATSIVGVLVAALLLGGFFSIVVALPSAILTDTLIENKDRQVTQESINKRRLMVYGIVFTLALVILAMLTAIPPLADLPYSFLSPLIVSVILAVVMLIAVVRYLQRLDTWLAQSPASETDEASTPDATPKPVKSAKSSAKKAKLPTLQLADKDETTS